MKHFTLGQAFTEKQLKEVIKLKHKERIDYIQNIMPQIEKRMGQEMDAAYLSYCVEAAVSQTMGGDVNG